MATFNVLTNHYPIKNALAIDRKFYQYRIAFEGVSDEPRDTSRRVDVIRRMQTNTHPEVFPSRAFYDGRNLLYSSQPLRLGSDRLQVNMSDRPNPRPAAIKVVKFQRTSGELVDFRKIAHLVQHGQETNESIAAITVMQLIIRASANENFVSNGKSYFCQGSARRLAGGLEAWKGFFQSVRPVVGRVMINVDTTVAIMVQSGHAIDVCLQFLRGRDVRDLNLTRNSKQYRELEKFLKKILVAFPGSRNPRAIKALEPMAGRYEFTKDDGVHSTVAEHFYHHHNINIRYPDMVGVNITGKNSERPAIIPLECCKIVAGQFHKGRLPDETLREVIKMTAMKPGERRNVIQNGNPREDYQNPIQTYSKSEYIIEAGLDISRQLASVTGHILKAPTIMYDGKELLPKDGGWNSMGQRFQNPSQLSTWAAVNFSRIPERDFRKIISDLARACTSVGMRVSEPGFFAGVAGHPQEIFERARQQNPAVELFVVLLPNQAEEIRNAIKNWGDTVSGVLTQCMREGKRFNDQYLKNVALKINARMGGCNSLAKAGVLIDLSSSPYLIMGADVSHAAPGSIRPSVAGIVYSTDRYATKYAATTRIQNPRVEQIEDLKSMVHGALLQFCMMSRAVPSRFFFYRDGLSEGEFSRVGQAEIEEIEAAIEELMQHPNSKGVPRPRLTYIIVGKRHHTIFFPENDRDHRVADKNGNLQAGFASIEGLRNPTRLDFYLQSHSAIQGTARSAHYIVLKDENWDEQQRRQKLQELSYVLCHVYAKATRSVSIPAPVYYADLVCSRSKFHFNPDMVSDSSDSGSGFNLDIYQQNYRALHPAMKGKMYFL